MTIRYQSGMMFDIIYLVVSVLTCMPPSILTKMGANGVYCPDTEVRGPANNATFLHKPHAHVTHSTQLVLEQALIQHVCAR